MSTPDKDPHGPMGMLKKMDGKADSWIRSWNPYDPSQLQDRKLQPVQVEESQIRKSAARWFFIGLIIFLGWAFWAPLDAGVNIGGNVVVSGYRKSVQHQSGGVVQEIMVREGDLVKQNDVLIKINPLNSEASLTNAELQYINLLVTESRLRAERLSRPKVEWVKELDKWGDDIRVKEAKQLQLEMLTSRRAEMSNQVSGLHAQIAGIQTAIESRKVQLGTLTEELKSNQKLSEEGFVPRSQANNTLRSKVELESTLASAYAELGKTRAQIAGLQTAYLKEIDRELSETQKNREAFQTRFEAAKFDRVQTEIKAPVSGTVVGLKVFTVGGVITPGQLLMEILPEGGSLMVEAQVPTHLIDKVHVGLSADMRFTAFNMTTTPVVPGRVKLVGADKLPAKEGQQGEYYVAHIETTAEGLAMLGKLKVQAGMPVDVVVKRGERSFVSYLLKPLSDKLSKAFKD
ncbi:HlyD family type I secretion periplasmic adaptor subunit [Lacisediminimonas profundi]|uniref:HlyD family type I secretion periplasmic adaptor subunit n=1 Tax=Lacisediminimonas profundi TaxID=2603856 RepID=UPI00124B319A|nr:HlyD family type I secretion periplasmic adaptor subunit [Lacisediminimonas profundi]